MVESGGGRSVCVSVVLCIRRVGRMSGSESHRAHRIRVRKWSDLDVHGRVGVVVVPFPPLGPDLSSRSHLCGGSLDRVFLGHLCTIRPENRTTTRSLGTHDRRAADVRTRRMGGLVEVRTYPAWRGRWSFRSVVAALARGPLPLCSTVKEAHATHSRERVSLT